jgi:anti-sigma factor RsiW
VLTCYLTRRRLGAYLDGALDEGTARSTAAHVATCGVCRREVDELRRLRSLLQGNLGTVTDPDWTGFWPGVVRGIDAAKADRQGARAPRRWQPRWALGGALAAALLVSLGLWQFGPGTAAGPGVVVRSASTGDPRATVMVWGTPERDVAVVWVLGLDDK